MIVTTDAALTQDQQEAWDNNGLQDQDDIRATGLLA